MQLSRSDARAVLLELERRAAIAREAEQLEREKQEAIKRTTVWCPHTPTAKQAEFAALRNREALFGGAAGGGKSDAILMGALEYVDCPSYAALVLRRTLSDLTLPGALLDRARDWLKHTAAKWVTEHGAKYWLFPSGAKLAFGYLDTDKDRYRYQSSEFQYIGFDELTHFPEKWYRYMLSRCRKKKGAGLDHVPLRVRGATNPGGIGHQWVKKRFIDEDTREGRAFVPSFLEDNPHLDQDEYEKNLAELDEATYQQLRWGKWIQDHQTLVYSFRRDRNLIKTMPANYPIEPELRGRVGWSHVLALDYGTSETTPTTAMGVIAWHKHERRVYIPESKKVAGMTTSTIAEEYQRLEERYHGFDHVVGDQGGLGAGYNKELRMRHGIPVRDVEKKNKLGFRRLMNGSFEQEEICAVESANEDLIEEWENLLWNEDGTDNIKGSANHCSDVALYGWREARHWMSKEPEKTPEEGTAEYERYVNRMRRAQDIERLQRKGRRGNKGRRESLLDRRR